MTKYETALVRFCALYLVVGQGVLFLALIILMGSSAGREGVIILTLIALVLVGITIGITHVLKHLFKRRRPAPSTHLFTPRDIYAFPSKHAAALAVLATYIGFYSLFLGIFAWLITAGVSYGRVKSNVHYLSDIIGGIMLGVLVAYLFTPCISASVNFLVTGI